MSALQCASWRSALRRASELRRDGRDGDAARHEALAARLLLADRDAVPTPGGRRAVRRHIRWMMRQAATWGAARRTG